MMIGRWQDTPSELACDCCGELVGDLDEVYRLHLHRNGQEVRVVETCALCWQNHCDQWQRPISEIDGFPCQPYKVLRSYLQGG